MDKDQVLFGWTISNVKDQRLLLRSVNTEAGGHIIANTMKMYQLIAFQTMVRQFLNGFYI